MSLKTLDLGSVANSASVMPVLHPTDRTALKNGDVEITLSLISKYSDAFIKSSRLIRNKIVKNAQKKAEFSAAEQDHQAIETIARCTTAWAGVPKCWIDGSDDETTAECNFDNAVALYVRQQWVFEQADDFVGDLANLLKAASKS